MPTFLNGARAASTTLVKMCGDRDSPNGGLCTDMPYPQKQIEEMVCVEVNQDMEVFILQLYHSKPILLVNTCQNVPLCQHLDQEVCAWPDLEHAGLGLDLHPLPFFGTMKGCKELSSTRLEERVHLHPLQENCYLCTKDRGILLGHRGK